MQSASRVIRLGQSLRRPPCFRGTLLPLPSDAACVLSSRLAASTTSAFPTPPSSRYAAVDHSHEYDAQVNGGGRHGKQLALAQLAGEGKDDPVFDPFFEDELKEEEERRLAASGSDESPSAASDDEDIEGADEAEEDDEEYDDSLVDSIYNRDGSLKWSKAERAVLRAGAPAGGLFAVLELAGSQYKVTTDDVLIVNRLPPPFHNVGSTHEISSVLLAGSTHMTLVGLPTVTGARVKVMVEEITKDEKVIVFRKRRRKNWKKKNGFRRDITMLRILGIELPPPYDDHLHVERVTPKAMQLEEISSV